MGPQPELISAKMLEELGHFTRRHSTNAFALQRYRRQAEKLREVDEGDYFTILGAIACLEADFPKMHKYHGLAIAISHGGSEEVFNYCASLEVSCLWQEAYDLALKFYNQDRNDPTRVIQVLEKGKGVLRYHEMLDYLDVWHKLVPGEEHPDASSIYEIIEFMDAKSITDDDFSSYCLLVSKYLQGTDVIITTSRTRLIRNRVYISYKVADAGANIARITKDVNEIFVEHHIDHLLHVRFYHQQEIDMIEVSDWSEAIDIIIDDFGDTSTSDICIDIIRYMSESPVDKLSHIAYGSIKTVLSQDYSDDDILKAIQYLCGDRVHLFDAGFEFIDGDDVFHLSPSDVKMARTEGKLVHPRDGELLSDFGHNVFIFFQPSSLAKRLGL